LSDALLAGPAEQWSAHARCARALDATPPWLPALCRKMTLDFASRWHDDFRHVLAEAICSWPQFLQAWASEHRPYLRYYFVESPRMGARPLALEHCALPDIPTVGAIADWLRLDVRDVDWLADCRGREASAADERLRHYRYCWVRKRTVGYRLLEMPKTALRTVQRRILRELLEYVPPHDAAHGFRARHSCLTHARQHVGQDIVIRMDLKDFFLSFGAARVRALFRTLGYPRDAARTLAGLCTNSVGKLLLEANDPAKYAFELPQLTWEERKRYQAPHLPQGAPTSPALANLCAFGFDLRLHALAQSIGARYTRYADDLTFSGGKEVARASQRLIPLIGAIALDEGLAINHHKTQVMRRSTQQRVTGIVVNQKINPPRGQYDRLKAILYNCARHGPQTQNRHAVDDFRAHLAGRIAHCAMLSPARGAHLKRLFARIAW